MDLDGGQFLGRYQLLKRLAVGGMGEVYLASQAGPEGFERFVVVKRMIASQPSVDDEPLRLLVSEARLVAKLSHRNIAQIHELGRDEDGYFVAMEYVKGPSLRSLVDRLKKTGQRLHPDLALDIVAQVADALAYAYSAPDDAGVPMRIVHRDVSPENILVSIAGDVKLIDFGVAKTATRDKVTQSEGVKGKLAYMSPEQAAGKPLDARSDLFSLGIVLCELLTGDNPFAGEGVVETMYAIQHDAPRLPSATDPSLIRLDPLIQRMLARWPGDRPADANELYEELAALRARLTPSPVRLGLFVKDLFGADIAELTRTFSDPELRRSLHEGLTGMFEVPDTRPTPFSPDNVPTLSLPASRPSVVPLPQEPAGSVVVATSLFEPPHASSVEPSGALPLPLGMAAGLFCGVTLLGLLIGAAGYLALRTPETPQEPVRALPVRTAQLSPSASATPPTPIGIPTSATPAGSPNTPTAPVTLAVASPPAAAVALPPTPAPWAESTPTTTPAQVTLTSPATAPATAEPRPAQTLPTSTAPAQPQIPAATPVSAAIVSPSVTPRESDLTNRALPAAGVRKERAPLRANASTRKTLETRLRRVAEAWEARRDRASVSDQRVFDLTLDTIRNVIATGKEDDLAEAKSSLNEFVANALGGDEP